jgi:pyruvate/2-oxoglutarate dehydrogenase complex dihydrolipoamide dehydrogenase (E3) component
VLEKADRIGGQVNLAASPAYKKAEMSSIPAYYAAMLKKHGVDLQLRMAATPETVAPFNPDLVVLAVGSQPMALPVPGGERARAGADVLAEAARGVGQRVAVVGGNGVGLDVAMFLSEKGKDVTVLEMADDIGEDLHSHLRLQLKAMMADNKIEWLAGHTVTAVTETGVTVRIDGGTKEMAFDSVVAAVGFECADTCDLELALSGAGYAVRTVGTCVDPGHLRNAVHGGFWAAIED